MRVALAMLMLAVLAGCQATPAPTATELELQPGQYTAAFDTARDVLRDYLFTLNRVDGRSGVISTHGKPSAGLAEPWDHTQTDLGQELGDLMNDQRRQVRITFETAGPPPSPAPPTISAGPAAVASGLEPDVRAASAITPTIMRVHVVEERVERPIWRPDTSGVWVYTRASDPELVRRGMEPSYLVPKLEDRELAARIVQEVRERMASAESARTR